MPLNFIRGDITALDSDAIVNAANTTLLGGGGVDGAIHRAAGHELLEECRKLGGCEVGGAKLTNGYKLPAKYVIHTVGPIWRGGGYGEPELLRSCYEESLKLADEHGLTSIAFPLISAGAYGYPKDKALEIAVESCAEFLKIHEINITIVIFDRRSFDIGKQKISDIQAYIDDNYVEEHERKEARRSLFTGRTPSGVFSALLGSAKSSRSDKHEDVYPIPAAPQAEMCDECLADAVKGLDESFSEMLMRKIDERGMKDSECYKRANIDRKLFSKIRSNKDYHPKKTTAVAFAIALELDLHETNELLTKAGFMLSPSIKFDVIIEYFIEHRIYNIHEINKALFEFDQVLIGA